VTRRHLIPLALLVTALLAVVAISAHGRPLDSGGGTGSGLPRSFWDYVFTSLVLVELFMFAVALAALTRYRREPKERESFERRLIRNVGFLLAAVAIASFLARHGVLQRLLHLHHQTTTPANPQRHGGGGTTHHARPAPSPQPAHFRWDELAIFLGLLVVLGAVAVATRNRRGPPIERRRAAPEAIAAVLDESLDDLRADVDLRRAIVAAYARMEVALAVSGLPRRPAEAPLEYLERALLSLEPSADSVRRLTDLFEWARFSQHEPEPSMRDEAVDALVAVRDELRAPERILA
jgi:Domain of unknown function (DUF4129)